MYAPYKDLFLSLLKADVVPNCEDVSAEWARACRSRRCRTRSSRGASTSRCSCPTRTTTGEHPERRSHRDGPQGRPGHRSGVAAPARATSSSRRRSPASSTPSTTPTSPTRRATARTTRCCTSSSSRGRSPTTTSARRSPSRSTAASSWPTSMTRSSPAPRCSTAASGSRRRTVVRPDGLRQRGRTGCTTTRPVPRRSSPAGRERRRAVGQGRRRPDAALDGQLRQHPPGVGAGADDPELRTAGSTSSPTTATPPCVFQQRLPAMDFDLSMYISTAAPDPSVTRRRATATRSPARRTTCRAEHRRLVQRGGLRADDRLRSGARRGDTPSRSPRSPT